MLNASQLAQQYTTALVSPMTAATNPAGTLITTANAASLNASQGTSPYIFLSTSDEVCANSVGGNDLTGKTTTTLSSPSTFYFYNNNSMYPTEFLRL